MFSIGITGLLAAALTGASPGTARAITQAEEVVAIYVETDGATRVIMAAWPDGYVIRSEDTLKGGAPYFAGHIRPERLSAALGQVERDGGFGNRQLARARFGPDSDFTTLLFKKGKKLLKMQSWHEIAEADGRIVAQSYGLTALVNEGRLEALRKDTPEYLFYRLVWAELGMLAISLVPPDVHRVNGDVVKKSGNLTWRETSPK